LLEGLKPLAGRRVALLGLTYKAGTDTLRRSWAVELSHWLNGHGARVNAFDWQIDTLPGDLAGEIDLKNSPAAAMEQCDSMVVCTDHPKLSEITTQVLRRLNRPFIIDPNGSLRSAISEDLGPVEYRAVGLTISRS
jgi:UDPglucose 6-dehydrogenase